MSKLPESPWPTELIEKHKHESPADIINELTTPKTLQKRRLTWAQWKAAFWSGWRAGKKQMKKRATELRQQPRGTK